MLTELMVMVLVAGLGSDSFQTRQECHRTLSELNKALDLRATLCAAGRAFSHDPEVLGRLRLIDDDYRNLGVELPGLLDFAVDARTDDEAYEGPVFRIYDPVLVEVALRYEAISPSSDNRYYVSQYGYKWDKEIGREYVDALFDLGKTREEVSAVLCAVGGK